MHDKKDVSIISSVHTAKIIEFEDKNKEKKLKPKVAHDYNTMGGVDKVEEHLTYYPITRKWGKKYYQKILFPSPRPGINAKK